MSQIRSQIFSLLLITYILLAAASGTAGSPSTWVAGLLGLVNFVWIVLRERQATRRRQA